MPLSPERARTTYDRIGRLQNTQAFYEGAAVARMIELGDLGAASAVFELGCGTGRLARRLLARDLAVEATYLATDISPRMVSIAEERLRPWNDRAQVLALEPGAGRLPGDDGAFDRFLATYVFDLLEDGEVRRLLDEAARLLGADGRLCLVGITPGPSGFTRMVMRGWGAIATTFPRLVGGCRPTDARRLLDHEHWVIDSSEIVTRWGVSSQIVVARSLGTG